MPARLATLIAQFPPLPSPGEGSDSFRRWLSLFAVLMGLGFVIAIVGHLFKFRPLVLTGIVMVFGATAIFLVAVATHG
jgi:hypothetical protein